MEKQLYDLTNPQKSIWYTEQFYKGTNINNVCGTMMFNTKVQFDLLEKSLKLFVQKNDSFRTKVILEHRVPKQYFEDIADFNIDFVELADESDLKKLEKLTVAKTFNIINSFLFKIIIFKFPNHHGGFIFNAHHLISDAWTMTLLINGVTEIYSELISSNLSDNKSFFSYINYINKEKDYLTSEKFETDKIYWNSLFEKVPDAATIPSISHISIDKLSTLSERKEFIISEDLVSKINAFCKKHRVSLFNFFIGVFSLYIGRVSNLDEFTIGTPILNRSNFKEKQIPGMFISTIPLKISFKDVTDFPRIYL